MHETFSEQSAQWSKEREKTLAEANKEAKTRNKQRQKAVQEGHIPTRKAMESQMSDLKQNRREAYEASHDSTKAQEERISAYQSEPDVSRKIRETRQRIETGKHVSGVDVLHEQAIDENRDRAFEDLSQRAQRAREATSSGSAEKNTGTESKPKFLDSLKGWFKKAS